MIGLKGYTEYEHWIHEEGIDDELTLTYTYKPNGGAERAGQEVIIRSIKIRTGAVKGQNQTKAQEAGRRHSQLHNLIPYTQPAMEGAPIAGTLRVHS